MYFLFYAFCFELLQEKISKAHNTPARPRLVVWKGGRRPDQSVWISGVVVPMTLAQSSPGGKESPNIAIIVGLAALWGPSARILLPCAKGVPGAGAGTVCATVAVSTGKCA